MARAGRGDTFGAQHLRLVLGQVADTVKTFEGGLVGHMQQTGRIAGGRAVPHASAERRHVHLARVGKVRDDAMAPPFRAGTGDTFGASPTGPRLTSPGVCLRISQAARWAAFVPPSS